MKGMPTLFLSRTGIKLEVPFELPYTNSMKIKNTTTVMHGSPGYENREVISSISGLETDMITIEFESECFTILTKKDFDTFNSTGMVEYYRQFPDGRALEVLYVEGLPA
jgi:hypothetical protein